MFKPGDVVYGISELYDSDGKPSSHYALVTAVVNSTFITQTESETSVEYELRTPSGNVWGDLCPPEHVYSDKQSALNYMTTKWNSLTDWK